MEQSLRSAVFQYVKKKYHSEPEYLWERFPNYAIFRHADNRKWYGLVMAVPKSALTGEKTEGEEAPQTVTEETPAPEPTPEEEPEPERTAPTEEAEPVTEQPERGTITDPDTGLEYSDSTLILSLDPDMTEETDGEG